MGTVASKNTPGPRLLRISVVRFSEDYEIEKNIYFLGKKIIIFLKKLKTKDFFEDRKIRSSRLIFGQICRIYKDNLRW